MKGSREFCSRSRLEILRSSSVAYVQFLQRCTCWELWFRNLYLILLLLFYSRQDSNNRVSENHEEQSSQVPTEYFWEEEGLPMRLTINPTERVSITNDPYTEILLQKKFNEDATTDGSIYSDDDMTEFDTDSIRQLEWDCLESSVEAILQEQKERIGSSSDARTTIV